MFEMNENIPLMSVLKCTIPMEAIVSFSLRSGDEKNFHELRFTVKTIEEIQWMILTGVHGHRYAKLRYSSPDELYFKAPLQLVKDYLAFKQVDLSEATESSREKFYRLMAMLIPIQDKESVVFIRELQRLESERSTDAPRKKALAA